jgi:hypothetical protein
MRDSIGPVIKTEERPNPFEIERHDFDRRKRCKLRVAGAMVQMPVSVRHQKWKLFVALIRQQLQDRFGQRHGFRIGDGAGVN